MTDLHTLRTSWYNAQNKTLDALGTLLEKWRPLDHARYEEALRAERIAETNYYRALAAGHKPNFKNDAFSKNVQGHNS